MTSTADKLPGFAAAAAAIATIGLASLVVSAPAGIYPPTPEPRAIREPRPAPAVPEAPDNRASRRRAGRLARQTERERRNRK